MSWIRKHISDVIAWLIVGCAVASCSTPQELMQKAIDKDPDIISQYADTITLTRVKVDSVLVEVGDTVIWEKILTEVEYDTIIPAYLIEVERQKTRQQIRKAAKLEKYKARLEAKLAAQEAEYQFKIDKLTERLNKRQNKQEKRLESKEKRSNKFWIGFLLGVLSTVLLIIGLRLGYLKIRSLY